MNNKKICPKCGSEDTSSDVDMTNDDWPKIIREYDFCFTCGHKWNVEEKT